jgi:hypothetical protein
LSTLSEPLSKQLVSVLEGKDDEYVHWAGEYKLMQRLQDKLRKLQEISYHDPNLLYADQKDH